MSRLFNRLRLTKIPKTKLLLYSSGALFATGVCASSVSLNTTILAEYSKYESVEEHFHLLATLQKLAPKIDVCIYISSYTAIINI